MFCMIVVKKIFNKCIAIGQTSTGSFLDYINEYINKPNNIMLSSGY